jgi:kinesin family protein 11
LSEQRSEAEALRAQLCNAGIALIKANDAASARSSTVLAEEKERAAAERATLLSQITSLVQNHGEARDKRLEAEVISVQEEVNQSNVLFARQQESYGKTMDLWSEKEELLVQDMLKARENVKSKIKRDWTVSRAHLRRILLLMLTRLPMSTMSRYRPPRRLSTKRLSALLMPR